jgi:hypothetical protein
MYKNSFFHDRMCFRMYHISYWNTKVLFQHKNSLFHDRMCFGMYHVSYLNTKVLFQRCITYILGPHQWDHIVRIRNGTLEVIFR